MRMSLLIACVGVLSGSAALASEPPAPPPYLLPPEPEHAFPPALAPAYITDLQQQLVSRGYYAGAVDGRMSGALSAAVSVYQSDVGLRVTGVPDLAVVNMLRYGPNVRATIQPLGAPDKGADKGPDKDAGKGADKVAEKAPEKGGDKGAGVVAEPAVTVMPVVFHGGVPPYEPIEPYRPPASTAVAIAPQAEEPPLPKAAPQAKVVTQPLGAPGK